MFGREQPAITGFRAPLQQLAASTERKNRDLRDRTPSDTDNKCHTPAMVVSAQCFCLERASNGSFGTSQLSSWCVCMSLSPLKINTDLLDKVETQQKPVYLKKPMWTVSTFDQEMWNGCRLWTDTPWCPHHHQTWEKLSRVCLASPFLGCWRCVKVKDGSLVGEIRSSRSQMSWSEQD